MQAVFPKILQHAAKNPFFTKKNLITAMQLIDIKSNNTTRRYKKPHFAPVNGKGK